MHALAAERMTTQPDMLRRALLADVVVTGAAGLLMALAAGPLGDLFDLPVLLLRLAGLFLIPYTAFVLYVATRTRIPTTSARTIVGLNLLWAVASLMLIVSDAVDPSALGIAFVVAQALIVIAFAGTQVIGLRRTGE